MKKNKTPQGEITKNKKAFFDFEIIKSYEGGIELKGYETKSIRHGHINLKGSFLVVNGSGLYIKNMHITPWNSLPNRTSIDSIRERKGKKTLLFVLIGLFIIGIAWALVYGVTFGLEKSMK